MDGRLYGITNYEDGATRRATFYAINTDGTGYVATITFLKGGKPTGNPVTMRAGTVNGATVLTATKSFGGSKKTTSFQAQVSITLGPAHDQKSLDFKVRAKSKK